MRKIIAMIDVDDDRAIAEDLGTIEFLEKVCSYCSVINLTNARILDDDDRYDAKAIELANKIFEEE